MMDLNGLLGRGLGCSCRIGIGLPEDLASRVRRELADRHSGIEVVCYADPKSLVTSLKNGELDGAVRGTMSSLDVLTELKDAFGLKRVMRTAILEDVKGKQFLLTPVGIDEGLDRKARFDLVKETLSYFSAVGWNLDVGVLSKGRPEDKDRSKEIELSLKDGEWLVDKLRREGVRAEHYSILVENSVARRDLVVAPDGVAGNLMFRSMHFVGGGKAYGAPVVNLDRVFVDTSRAKLSFAEPLILAGGLVQAKSGQRRAL